MGIEIYNKARGGKLSACLVFGLPRDFVVCKTYSWSFQRSNSPHKLGDSFYEASGVNKRRESSLFFRDTDKGSMEPVIEYQPKAL